MLKNIDWKATGSQIAIVVIGVIIAMLAYFLVLVPYMDKRKSKKATSATVDTAADAKVVDMTSTSSMAGRRKS